MIWVAAWKYSEYHKTTSLFSNQWRQYPLLINLFTMAWVRRNEVNTIRNLNIATIKCGNLHFILTMFTTPSGTRQVCICIWITIGANFPRFFPGLNLNFFGSSYRILLGENVVTKIAKCSKKLMGCKVKTLWVVDTVGREIPVLNEEILKFRNKENVFRAKKYFREGTLWFSGDGEAYYMWDGKPRHYDWNDWHTPLWGIIYWKKKVLPKRSKLISVCVYSSPAKMPGFLFQQKQEIRLSFVIILTIASILFIIYNEAK